MIKFLTILFTFYTLNSFGQLPQFESNLTTKVSNESLVKLNFADKFDQILSYSAHSHWSEGWEYFVFGYDGKNWKLLRWTFELDEQKQLTNQRTKKLKFSQVQLDELLVLMSEVGFYTFKQGSLNLNRKDNGDGTTKVAQVNDGVHEEIELISPQSHRISSAYAADLLQVDFPTSDRGNFIICRNKLLKLVNGKS